MRPHVIGIAGGDMRQPDAEAAEDHQAAPSRPIDQTHRDQCEDQIDGARDHDIEQDIADAIAGAAINLIGIVEQDVDAAELLQNRQHDADQQKSAYVGREQASPSILPGTVCSDAWIASVSISP